MTDEFRRGYENMAEFVNANAAAAGAESYVEAVEHEIQKLEEAINAYKGNNSEALKGFIGEQWATGTFNVDAAANDSASRAEVLKLNDLGSVDVRVHASDGSHYEYQLKVNKTAERAIEDVSQTFGKRWRYYNACLRKSGKQELTFHQYLELNRVTRPVTEDTPLYDDQTLVIMSDILEDARKLARRKELTEIARRPDQVERYRYSRKNLADRISDNEGNHSKPTTDVEMRRFAEKARKGEFDASAAELTSENVILLQHIMNQAIKAGHQAAVISFVMSIAPRVLDILRELITNGEIDPSEFRTLGVDAIYGAAKGFINGSISCAVVIACKTGRLGEGLVNASPALIASATVLTIDTIFDAIRMVSGDITPEIFTDNMGQSFLVWGEHMSVLPG